MKIWKINGLELTLDMEDADTAERYESAFELMMKEENETRNIAKLSQKIRAYCKIFRNLYDRIFGEGTSAKIFENVPENSAEYDRIYCDFLDFVKNQRSDSAQRKSRILAKYSPNRQQRRMKKK
ncbi:MAG: hypothetical protein K2N27_06875 [Ruminococcus sp.]|nr:hypothetical protein [Ruminococcus sp.]